jgi:hypothetical protein
MPIVSTADNDGNGKSRRDAARPPQPADPVPATAKTWQALEKAARLVGHASELSDLPDSLRSRLLDILADLVWAAEDVRCPLCGSWRKGGHG